MIHSSRIHSKISINLQAFILSFSPSFYSLKLLAMASSSRSSDVNMIEAADLRYPDLIHHFHSINSLPIQTGKLVHFEAFTSFDLETSLQDFVYILGSSNSMSIYPQLIKIFYTNLSVNHDQSTITSMVHGKIISFRHSSVRQYS